MTHIVVRSLLTSWLVVVALVGGATGVAAQGTGDGDGTGTGTETQSVAEAVAETATEIETETETETAAASRSAERTDPAMEHLRFEGTLGFLGGWARYSDVGLSGSPALPASAFDTGAVAGSPIAGLRYDLRLVVAFVRMTAGADLAWSMFRAADTARPVETAMGAQSLSDRSVFLWALRFGLGLEARVDPSVRLFADVLGSVRFLEAQTSLDGTPVTQAAVSFAPGLRLGARFAVVDSFFVQVAADASPFGPWVAGELSVGAAIE